MSCALDVIKNGGRLKGRIVVGARTVLIKVGNPDVVRKWRRRKDNSRYQPNLSRLSASQKHLQSAVYRSDVSAVSTMQYVTHDTSFNF